MCKSAQPLNFTLGVFLFNQEGSIKIMKYIVTLLAIVFLSGCATTIKFKDNNKIKVKDGVVKIKK